MAAKEKEQTGDGALTVNERKWGATQMKAGYVMIPSVILERQAALGLDALDVNIIMHLANDWWTKESKAAPPKGTIAKAIGVDPRTVQRRIAKMEAAGFIRREYRRRQGQNNSPNLYHLDGLAAASKPFAQEKIDKRARQAADRAATAARKGKPKLHVVE